MKANNAPIKVIGYADKNTGTSKYNMGLSEKRAKNVANALIYKYNIASNRVTVEWKGDTEQPYAENAWNRVAIFFAE
jgi:outer membrane protein OmpA-like peptidoglycan-associated protein